VLKRFRSILRRNTIYRSYTRQLGMADREQLIGFLGYVVLNRPKAKIEEE